MSVLYDLPGPRARRRNRLVGVVSAVLLGGFATYVVDPDDPFPDGFTVGDIWA